MLMTTRHCIVLVVTRLLMKRETDYQSDVPPTKTIHERVLAIDLIILKYILGLWF